MKKTKRLLCLLLAGALTAGLCACTGTGSSSSGEAKDPDSSQVQISSSSAAASQTSHYPLTISTFNYAKEPVEETFTKAPERVITFWQNSMETMLALGLEERIVCSVGVTEEDITPSLREAYQKVKDKEYNSFSDSNAAISKEKAVMLNPDFILAWKSSFSDKTIGDVDYWHGRGTNTYIALNSNDISANRTVDNEYQDILTIGKIFDVEDKAQAIVDEMKTAVEKATKATEGKEKAKVLILEFLGGKIRVYDKTMLAGNMVTKMGGDLIDAEGTISAEDVIKLNPDVLFIIHMEGYGEGAGSEALKNITDNPAYASLECLKNNQVYPLNLSDVYTSGIRTIDGLNAIGKALYPDLY